MNDEFYMNRCLKLAALGAHQARPNPMVGSVLVHNGLVIGEGYHQRYGGAHAEVAAIESVSDPSLLSQCTLYVNLEPCAHHGKTPPCADLIIRSGIPKVVVANVDPHHRVGGKGIERMRAAGIEVTTGVLEQEGHWLNRQFFTFHEQQRPYVTLKWAQSQDGYVDGQRLATSPASAITGHDANVESHRWRATHQAILVGANTAILDNPSLSTRHIDGPSPLRIVLDPTLRVPNHAQLLSDGQPTLVINRQRSASEGVLTYLNIGDAPVIPALLNHLFEQHIIGLLVEGGAYTHQQFLDAGLWDEIRIWQSPNQLAGGVPAPKAQGRLHSTAQHGADTLTTYVNT